MALCLKEQGYECIFAIFVEFSGLKFGIPGSGG